MFKNDSEGYFSLGGFGAEFTLKDTEYTFVDDLEDAFSVETAFSPTVFPEKDDNRIVLNESMVVPTKTDKELLNGISLKAGAYIASSKDPLHALELTSGYFPTYFRSLTAVVPSEPITKVMEHNARRQLEDGLFLNGIRVRNDVDMYHLKSIFERELAVNVAARRYGVSPRNANELKRKRLTPETVTTVRFDVLDENSVFYVNDVDADPQYRRFSKDLQSIFSPTWRGELHYIGKNLYRLVVVLDPSELEGIAFMSSITYLLNARFPVQFGIVLNAPWHKRERELSEKERVSVKIGNIFGFICERYGKPLGYSFLNELARAYYQTPDRTITMHLVETAVNSLKRQYSRANLWIPLDRAAHAETAIAKAMNAFVGRKKLRSAKVLFFLNGKPFTAQPSNLYQKLFAAVKEEEAEVAGLVKRGLVTDKVLPTAYYKREGLLLPTYSVLASATPKPMRNAFAPPFYVRNDRAPASGDFSSTVQIFADFCAPSGKDMLEKAVESIPMTYRVAFYSTRSCAFAEKLLGGADAGQTTVSAAEFKRTVGSLSRASRKSGGSAAFAQRCAHHRRFVHESAEEVVVVNGLGYAFRADEPLDSDDYFIMRSFYEEDNEALLEMLGAERPTAAGASLSDRVYHVASLLAEYAAEFVHDSALLPAQRFIGDREMPLRRTGAAAICRVDLVSCIFSAETQRMSGMLRALSRVFELEVDVHLVATAPSELPLRTYFQFFSPPEVQFDEHERLVHNRSMVVTALPQDKILTLKIDHAQRWNVMPVVAKADLDNVILRKVKGGAMDAIFSLENIVIEGSSYDDIGTPPRTLQLQLSPKWAGGAEALRTDTIVMSIKGYFQLKAVPGIWELEIKPGTRSAELYDIVDAGKDSTNAERIAAKVDSRRRVAVTNLSGESINLVVRKKAGRETDELFTEEPDENANGAASKPRSRPDNARKASGSSESGSGEKREDVLNIFSVASGTLYERFLKLMIHTVVTNTKTPVKFWFIKNFLTSRFKETLPLLAKHYGFRFELVTYQWPDWLTKQTQKMRTIWGYKILFLDVLFPLSVDKVIFVDADQIVKTDLRELRDLDLHGDVIGMTPFCRGALMNQETKKYRFWDFGFWKEHLRGKPYHISALFVVDLKKFRERAVGDIYRSNYNALSQVYFFLFSFYFLFLFSLFIFSFFFSFSFFLFSISILFLFYIL